MTVIAAAVKHMLAAGMPAEAIVAAVEEMELVCVVDKQAERRRAVDRLRKRNDWHTLRMSVFERDNFQCVYCGCSVYDDPQCDHVHPISRGGANSLENLATACRSCNSRKGARTPKEWRL